MPTRGRKVKSGQSRASEAISPSVRWLTQTVRVPTPAATTSFISRRTSDRCEAAGHRQVERDALEPDLGALLGEDRGRLAQPLGGEPVAQHRRRPLQHDPGVRLGGQQAR